MGCSGFPLSLLFQTRPGFSCPRTGLVCALCGQRGWSRARQPWKRARHIHLQLRFSSGRRVRACAGGEHGPGELVGALQSLLLPRLLLLWAKCSSAAPGRGRVVPGVLKLQSLFCSESTFQAAAPYVRLNKNCPCNAHGRAGLPCPTAPHAAGEITLYNTTTIYLWYVLIYNIHCVC